MRKVIGIGETVLDIIFKENKPVEAVPGGSIFNAITSLGRCGINTSFISEAGNDHVGKYIVDFLKDNGVNADNVTTFPDSKSPVSLAFLNDKNDADYIFYKEHPHHLLDFTYPEIKPDDIVIFGSFYAVNPMIRPQVLGLLDYARSHGAIIYYDVNFRPAHKDEVIKDFATLYKKEDADKVYNAEISFYCKQFIYTQGSQPVEVRSGRTLKKSYPVLDTNVISTIGAGDNFNAGFIFGMLKHNITRTDLEQGLTEEQWDKLINYALMFSADCCKDIFNYVSKEFGEKMKEEAL